MTNNKGTAPVEKIVEALRAAGIDARPEYASDIGVEDDSVVVSERVHVQVGSFAPYANVVEVSADGESFTFYRDRLASSVKAIVADVKAALASVGRN